MVPTSWLLPKLLSPTPNCPGPSTPQHRRVRRWRVNKVTSNLCLWTYVLCVCVCVHVAVEAAGGKALPCVVDIRDEQQIGDAVQKAVDAFGGKDTFSKSPLIRTGSKLYPGNTPPYQWHHQFLSDWQVSTSWWTMQVPSVWRELWRRRWKRSTWCWESTWEELTWRMSTYLRLFFKQEVS